MGKGGVLGTTDEALDFTCTVELEPLCVTNNLLTTTNRPLKTSFFLDSGASHSILSKREFEKNRHFWKRAKFYRKNIKAISADGSLLKYYGTVLLTVKNITLGDKLPVRMHVAEEDKELELHILDIAKDAILGLPDLGRFYLLYYMQLAYEESRGRDKDGVLHNNITNLLIDINQMSLNQEKYDKIKRLHHHIGHGSTNRLKKRIAYEGIKDLSEPELKEFIKYCTFCHKSRYVHQNSPKYSTFTEELGKYWQVDILYAAKDDEDVYDTSTDEKNPARIYFVVCVEKMSRWVEIIPIFNLKEDEVFRAMLILIGRFGFINELSWQSDRGSNICSKLNEKLMRYCKIAHKIAIPYSHQQQGMVENRNREINRIIRGVLYDLNDKYESMQIFIPLVQRILNSMPIKTTGFAPAEILFPGVDLNTDILNKRVKRIKELSPDDYVHMVADVQASTIKKVLENQRHLETLKFKELEDDKVHDYHSGDLVLVLYADKVKPNKWHTPYYGPLKVVEQIEGDGFVLCELSDEEIKQTVHISRMKPFFYYDARYVDVLTERLKDRREQKIEKILSHRGRIAIKGSNNNSVEFLVLYADGSQTWTPYGKLRKIKILQEYLLDQKNLRGLTKRTVAKELNMITININLIKVLDIKAEECMRPHQLDYLKDQVLKWNYPANSLEDGVIGEDIDIAINKSDLKDVFIEGTAQEKERIETLLYEYSDVFGKLDTNGMENIQPMSLNIKQEELHSRAINMFQPAIVGEALTHLTDMITEFEALGIIEKAKPDTNGDYWCSRINLINETVNEKIKYRFTLDYSALNSRLQDYYFLICLRYRQW